MTEQKIDYKNVELVSYAFAKYRDAQNKKLSLEEQLLSVAYSTDSVTLKNALIYYANEMRINQKNLESLEEFVRYPSEDSFERIDTSIKNWLKENLKND